jgi:histidinol-phosphate/aromatic aminotransferase/cobyric acid decarboxylase-like protein
VNASIYTALGRLNGYPDRHATSVRAVLAERLEVGPERIVLGNGAAELLQAAAMAIL